MFFKISRRRGWLAWDTKLVACITWIFHQSLIELSSFFSPMQLHCHLGHPSLLTLKRQILSLHNVSSLECEVCLLRKHHHVYFPLRTVSHASYLFEIVHLTYRDQTIFLLINFNILFLSWMTIFVWLCCSQWKIVLSYFLSSKSFVLWSKISLIKKFVFCGLIILKNTFLLLLYHLSHPKT